jgi:hypothetical protein
VVVLRQAADHLRLVLQAAARTLPLHRAAVSQAVVQARAAPEAAGRQFSFEIAA